MGAIGCGQSAVMDTTKNRISFMLVEDEAGFQDSVKLVLSLDPRFYVSGSAMSGEEALEHFDDIAPDIVLLDFRLPGIDGLETARRMKARRPNVEIVMVTAHTEEVVAKLARQLDIRGVIPKARFSLEGLRRALDLAP